jgi:hypothetical protein
MIASLTSTIAAPRPSQPLKAGAEHARYLPLSKPLLVNCKETLEDAWRIRVVTERMSLYGAFFALGRPVSPGRVIQLVFPGLHYRLRHYNHADDFYKIWAIVRSCQTQIGREWLSTPKFVHDVTFFGLLPPSQYAKDPTAHFDLDPSGNQAMLRAEEHSHQLPLQLRTKSDKDRRTNERYSIPYEFTLATFTNEGPDTTICERTITENISSCGALMRTTLDLNRGAMVWVTCDELQLRLAAIVRHVRPASNQSFNYLHLQWIGSTWAMPGLQ